MLVEVTGLEPVILIFVFWLCNADFKNKWLCYAEKQGV